MVSSTFMTLLLGAISCGLVLGAPVTPLDAATLLKNGQGAQKQNVAFQTMKEADPCTDGDKACMSGGVAVCRNGKWNVAQGACSKSQACFALPDVGQAGTLVMCTSEKKALAAIEATGATGGIFGNSTASAGDQVGNNDSSPVSSGNSADTTCNDGGDATSGGADSGAGGNNNSSPSSSGNSTDTTCDDGGDTTADPTSTAFTTSTNPTPSSSLKSTDSSSAAESPSTSLPSTITDSATVVTVTLTVGDQPTTLPPVTTTLSPEEASSHLASLIAHGATLLLPPPSATASIPSSSGAVTVTGIPTSAPVHSSSGSSSPTIVLTPTPNPTRAVALAARSVTSAAASQNVNCASCRGF
ncbi:putative carbohydrate-binding module family 19 protein [Lyophyllum shimeji]|uniref:Carbohydrate-binding module family 19 protein n=1 Tax=Lyophyllum shimeji TaxID=47721 RepID=A0A9P3PPC9_LYOSH|nr:putative carbohydrate-binding module family 19 protein [Lyophyllum shimeji]